MINEFKIKIKIPEDALITFRNFEGSYNNFYLIRIFLFNIIVKVSDLDDRYILSNENVSIKDDFLSSENTVYFISNQLINVPSDYLIKCEKNILLLTKTKKPIYILTSENMLEINNLICKLKNIIQTVNVQIMKSKFSSQYEPSDCLNFYITIEMFCLLHIFNTILVYHNNNNVFTEYQLKNIQFNHFDNNVLNSLFSKQFVDKQDLVSVMSKLYLLLNIFPLQIYHYIDINALPTLNIESFELYNNRLKTSKDDISKLLTSKCNVPLKCIYDYIVDLFKKMLSKFKINTFWDCFYMNISQFENKDIINNKDIYQFYKNITNYKKHVLYDESNHMLYYMIFKIMYNKLVSCIDFCKSTNCNKIITENNQLILNLIIDFHKTTTTEDKTKLLPKTEYEIWLSKSLKKYVLTLSPIQLIEIFKLDYIDLNN